MENMQDLMDSFTPKPPCNCHICQSQYRTKEAQRQIQFVYDPSHNEYEDVAKIRSTANDLVASINADRSYLRGLLELHGETLLVRWQRNPAKRKKYLDKQPSLYPRSQPLIDLGTRLAGRKMTEQRSYKSVWLMPNLDRETLQADSARLPKMLYHRIVTPPGDFAPIDNFWIQTSWRPGMFLEKFAEGCISLREADFGAWKDFDKDLVHQGYGYGTPRALLILEAQKTLFSFLRGLCDTILSDVVAAGSITQDCPSPESAVQPDAQTARAKGLSKMEGFAKGIKDIAQSDFGYSQAWTDLSYGRPDSLSLDVLLQIAAVQSAEAQDELWLLQTDIVYLYNRLQYHESHWYHNNPDLKAFLSPTDNESLDCIAFLVTIKPLVQARDWEWIMEQCRRIEKNPNSQNLAGLEALLLEAEEWHRGNLKRFLMKSPAFGNFIKLTGIGRFAHLSSLAKIEIKYDNLIYEDPVGWCLVQLIGDPKDWQVFDHHVVFQHFDKLLHKDPKQRHRIDADMHRCLSDLVAVKQMLTVLELHRPRYGAPSLRGLPWDQPAMHVISHQLLSKSPRLPTEMGLGVFVSPFKKLCPPSGRKNKQWLATRDEAYANLGKLWAKAREEYQAMLS